MPKGRQVKTKPSEGQGGGGIVFNKGFGQHILINPLILNGIVEKAGIRPSDIVLEIGPGTGNLTVKLLEAAKEVIAFEVDPRMIAELRKRVQGKPYANKLKIVEGNAIKQDFPFFNVCVANVPYAISSPLVFKLLEHRPQPRCAVLMLQREFALRMAARPATPMWGRLSVNCQLQSKVDVVIKVSANSFKPPPKVESAVIRMEPLPNPPPVDFEEWDNFIKICFQRRNKKLRSLFVHKTNLENLFKIHTNVAKMTKQTSKSLEDFKAVIEKIFEQKPPRSAGTVDEAYATHRAANMSLEHFLGLFNLCLSHEVRFFSA